MRTDEMTQGFHERGIIVLAPTLLLLTAVIIFTHANSERLIRLQQGQSTHQTLIATYANAHSTLRQILAIIRTAPAAQLTEQLAFANTRITTDAHVTPDGREITSFQFAFEENVTPTTESRTFYAEAIRYSALIHLPTASFFSSDRLPATTKLTVWQKTGQPGIAATVHPTTPADNVLHCRENRLPMCEPYPRDALSTVKGSIVSRLFNRSLDSLSADMFIGSIRSQRCENITLARPSVIWVSGDCQLSVNQTLGTVDDPVLLVIENGDLRLASGANITGLVVVIRRNSALASAIRMASNAFVMGAIVTTAPLDSASHIQLIADTDVLITLQRADALAKVTLVPGSWRDFD